MSVMPVQRSQSSNYVDWKPRPNSGPSSGPHTALSELSLEDLAEETILVAASHESTGFAGRVLSAFAERGITPVTRPDPYPDLGLQAVGERLGVVIYARSAFPEQLEGSVLLPLVPTLAGAWSSSSSSRGSRGVVSELARWRARSRPGARDRRRWRLPPTGRTSGPASHPP